MRQWPEHLSLYVDRGGDPERDGLLRATAAAAVDGVARVCGGGRGRGGGPVFVGALATTYLNLASIRICWSCCVMTSTSWWIARSILVRFGD